MEVRKAGLALSMKAVSYVAGLAEGPLNQVRNWGQARPI